METYKIRGIILHTIDAGESNKRLVILAKEVGKVFVTARGARKQKSKLLAGTQIFTYADFVISKSKGFDFVSQIDIIESFYEIRNDYESLCYGAYFLEICNKTILDNVACDELMLLLLKSLQMVSRHAQKALVCAIFEMKFLQFYGYSPELEVCSHCGNHEEKYFRMSLYGVICSECLTTQERVFPISEACLYTLRYIQTSDLQGLFQFQVADQILKELIKISDICINSQIGVNIKSKKILKEQM